jgi:hypothetical protein
LLLIQKRQIKNYANEANEKIRHELGPEFDEVRAAARTTRQ